MALVQATAWAVPFAPISEGRGRPSNLDDRWPADSSIRLCAIRVEFQRDSLTGTTGNGSFGSGFPDSLLIDPLPHDRQYFEDHLAFLSHYFTTASRSRLDFERLDVFPNSNDGAYQLTFPMWHYNFNTDTALLNQRLVELFAQAVTLASADIDFTQYDAILVIHAGVGKDFNVGFDNTPFDIPSAYISENDLARYGGVLPAGVTRGLLLPEAQNQPETLELGVELSLNGVMIKLFGNWLGMPDLFNTETGASGIGRWGMMDQGSGNVNALVPALPDAWSRLFMEWSDASVVNPSGLGDTVQVGRFNNDSVPEIIKIPLSNDEYYLLENRDADADSIGYVTVFDRDDREMRLLRNGDVTIEAGFKVAVRASHYDYGVPGSGILIWKINEQVIAEKYATNRVNTDPENRGVDLVEADGSQDIGRQFGFATAGSGTELGIQEDCWYRDNRAYREANGGTVFVRFNDNSRPSARLHDHSFTFLALSDFSDVGPVMSVRIRGAITVNGFPVYQEVTDLQTSPWTIADLNNDGRAEVCFQSGRSYFAVYDSTGVEELWDTIFQAQLQENRKPVDLNKNGFDELWTISIDRFGFVEYNDGTLISIQSDAVAGFAIDDLLHILKPDQNRLVVTNAGRFAGDSTIAPGEVLVFEPTLELLHSQDSDWGRYTGVNNLSSAESGDLLFWSADSAALVHVTDSLELVWRIALPFPSENPTTIFGDGQTTIFFPNNGYVNYSTGELICSVADCLPPEVDWDQDGRVDGGGSTGADHTPREDFAYSKLYGQEALDLNFDGAPDLLQLSPSKTSNGVVTETRISALDHDGVRYGDFPLIVSGSATVLQLDSNEHRYYAVTETQADSNIVLSLIRLPVVANGSAQVNFFDSENNIIFIGQPRPQVHAREEFAYVWPNPAAETAYIRLTLPYAAQADVSIFDLAGRKVEELSGSSSFAGAFEILWQTGGVQSGVYIGRVEVHGGGQTKTAELKIAVVR